MAAQQQYVPVSMVEPNGRQMLAVQTSWPTSSRQMAAIVPSWQGIPTQHATIQQPLSDLTDWGRPLLVDSSALIQVRILRDYRNNLGTYAFSPAVPMYSMA